MSLATRARDAACEAVIAGGVLGAGEAAGVVSAAGAAAGAGAGAGAWWIVWWIVAGAAALGAIAAAMIVRVGLAAVERAPGMRPWIEGVRGARAAAVVRGAIVMVTLAIAAALAASAAVRVYEAHRDHTDVHAARVVAGVEAGIALALVVGGLIAQRSAARRAADRRVGRAGVIAFIAAAIGGVGIVPPAIAHHVLPALTVTPIVIAAGLVSAVIAARVLRVGRRRGAWIAAVMVVVAAAVGTFELRGSGASRGAIVSQGTASRFVARMIWKLADHDGDGYAGPGVGGADCDDGDKQRNPGALEIPGNGIDENCTGADARDQGMRSVARLTGRAVDDRPNVVLISIDALRADHLGAYGYRRSTSPTIDALAATGVRFEYTYTSCPSTRCAIPSMLTGRYASTLRKRAERDDVPTIATAFRAAGYETAAITCCARFALATREMAGFDVVDASADAVRMTTSGQSNGAVVIDNALAWLAKRDPKRPYLLWIHLYEPHFPYAAPSGPDFGDDDIDRYDREIAYADAQLARLLPTLDAATTVVALTADHGDEFGEHGIRFHARSLYNQVVRIPLIIRAPKAAPRVVATPVSLVDVMPTLLELAQLDGPAGMNGASLAAAVRGGEAAPERPLLMELIPDAQIKRNMAGVVSAPWKVIWDREANAWSLFDLSDATDAHDRASDPALPTLQKLLRDTLDRETSRLP